MSEEVRSSYNRVAGEYAQHLWDELRHKPKDRELLDDFAGRVKGRGMVCDLGCGPGQVARYLSERDIPVCGVDVSPEMVIRAQQLNPGIEFTVGDMRALKVADDTWAGIAAFYAIVNLPDPDLHLAIQEMRRVLQPEGWLLLSFHVGDETVHLDELWGCAVCLDFYFRRSEDVASRLRSAGLEVEKIIEREPYAPEVEYQSRRAYLLARKPSLNTTSL